MSACLGLRVLSALSLQQLTLTLTPQPSPLATPSTSYSATSCSLHSHRVLLLVSPIGRPPVVRLRLLATARPVIVSAVDNYDRSVDPACTFCTLLIAVFQAVTPSLLIIIGLLYFFLPPMSIHHSHTLPPSPSSEGQASQPPPTPTTATQATQAAPAKRSSRRANTAERRATHNAVERARRETLNGRFLVSGLLP